MKDKHQEAFEDFAEEALEEFETVEKITLFGSVARGEHGANSDADILIEVRNLGEKDEIENLAFDKTTQHGISITPIIKEGKHKTSFLETVEKEGIEYVRS